jgi:RecB family exonuclease
VAQFWQALPDRNRRSLVAMSPAERVTSLERAADQALARVRRQRIGSLSEALISIERRRLVGIVMRWLQFEIDDRADFEVAAIEERRSMAIGPLLLNGRLDRVDRLPDGRTIIIDYKTGGDAGVRSWLGPRPDELQLPLYLVGELDAPRLHWRVGETRCCGSEDD